MIHPYVNSKPGVGCDNDCSTCGGKFRDSVHGATDEERFKYSAQSGVEHQHSLHGEKIMQKFKPGLVFQLNGQEAMVWRATKKEKTQEFFYIVVVNWSKWEVMKEAEINDCIQLTI